MLSKNRQNNSVLGVNVAGHISGEFGGGQAARVNLKAMEAVSIPFTVKDIKISWHSNLDDSYTSYLEKNLYSINLIHTVPEKYLLEMVGADYFQGCYNIGFWAWELPIFPKKWEFAFDYFDEIWTPSNYSGEAIAAVSPIPVIKIPHSIYLPPVSLGREALRLPKNKFIFLFMFDFHSTLSRKNPAGLIEAFKKAFGNSHDDVLLVIKFSNSGNFPKQRKQLQEMVEGINSIQFIDGHLRKEELYGLFNSCDCYVSLHRSEGFGLTMAEAMYYGKPVIGTGYSSNTEFMNTNNSFLVKYNLIPIGADDGPYYLKGNFWAEPDLDHTAFLMKYVFENQQQGIKIGKNAARDIKSLFSPLAIGKKIKARLEYIHNNINCSTKHSSN